MSMDDAGHIARIIGGEKELYGTLVDRYKEAVYRHCFYIMHDEDMAEDMAQEAFIQAYLHLSRYQPEKATFKTWLFVIATRQCLSQLRRKQALPLKDDEIVVSPLCTEQRANDQEVRDAVMRLRPNYRTVVSLYYWHGYSYDEIAQVMGVPTGSVRGWLHRAKQQLKEALS
jgi:RNA polymerase sigma-70 factor, ECF subfamily